MARLSYPDPASLTPEAREMLERLPMPLNVFRMLSHAQSCLKPVMKLGGAILARQQLGGLPRELALMQAMRLQHGEYEWHQHRQILLDVGGTEAQITAIENGELDAPCFDEAQRALLGFTTEVVERVGASEAALARLRAHFDEREMVELIVVIGFYSMLARLTETTGVEIDDAAGGRQMMSNLRARVGSSPVR